MHQGKFIDEAKRLTLKITTSRNKKKTTFKELCH